MKRMIKCFSFLTVLVALFALMTVAAYADEPDPFDKSLVFAPETQLTVYVDGEWSSTLSDSYGFGDKATLNAPAIEGKTFSHWTADGSIISYANTLKLTMNAHTTLYAVYADAAPTAKPVAGFTSITRTNDGTKISFQAIASGDTAGIIYSTTATGSNLTIGGNGVTNVAAEKLTDSTTTLPASILDNNNCWMLQITPDSADTVYHVRAYVTTGSETTYGDVKDVKLSDLESGISMIANLEGFEPGTDDLLEEIAKLRAENPASVTKAPTARNLSYNGQAQALVTAGVASGGEMRYVLGTDDKTVPTTGYTTSIPTGTEIGTYHVWYKVKGDGDHSDTEPSCVTVTISPKSLTGAAVTLDKTQLTYNGSEQSVSVTGVTLDGEILSAGTDYTVSGNTATEKNEYTVTVTGKGNYKDFATAKWEIVTRAMTVSADNVSAVYDGKEYGVTVKVTDPSDSAVISYGMEEGRCDLSVSPKFRDAGTHTVYFKVAGSANYSEYKGTATVTISKKPVTASVFAEDKTYDGKMDAKVQASVSANDLIEGDSIEITGLKGHFLDAQVGENKKVTVDSSQMTITGTGSGNYEVTIPNETTAAILEAPPGEPGDTPGDKPQDTRPEEITQEQTEITNQKRDKLVQMLNAREDGKADGIYQNGYDTVSVNYVVSKGRITQMTIDVDSLKEGKNYLTINTGVRIVLGEGDKTYTISCNDISGKEASKAGKSLKKKRKEGWVFEPKRLKSRKGGAYQVTLSKGKVDLIVDVIDVSLNKKEIKDVVLTEAVTEKAVSTNAVPEAKIGAEGSSVSGNVVTIATSPVLRSDIPSAKTESARFISGVWKVGDTYISRGEIKTITKGKAKVIARANTDGTLSIGKAEGSGKGSIKINYVLNGKVRKTSKGSIVRSMIYKAKIKVE